MVRRAEGATDPDHHPGPRPRQYRCRSGGSHGLPPEPAQWTAWVPERMDRLQRSRPQRSRRQRQRASDGGIRRGGATVPTQRWKQRQERGDLRRQGRGTEEGFVHTRLPGGTAAGLAVRQMAREPAALAQPE